MMAAPHPFDDIRISQAEQTSETGRKVYRVADSGYPKGSPWTVEQYEESAKQESVHYFLAELNSEAVGFVGTGIVGPEAEIHSIAVAEKVKQNGVGYLLLSYLTEWLKEKGVEEVFLEVRESNKPAIRLYTKAGFQFIGKRPRYYSSPTEDAYMMKLELNVEGREKRLQAKS